MRIIRLATVRHVRTEAGVEFFHAPIGTPITEGEYQELLRQRRLMRAAYEKGHPKRLEAERAIRQARKVRRAAGVKDDDEEEAPKEPNIFDEIAKRNKELEEKWRAEDEENARQAEIEAKLDKQRQEINDASEYYRWADPNFDPAREDVAKPLWHALESAIENANDTLDEGKQGRYGTPTPDWVPKKEWDQAYINLVHGAFDDNPYRVGDFVDIKEAARRIRNGELDKPLDRTWDHAIWDTWLHLTKTMNSSDARRLIAEQQGLTVGGVSRAMERHQQQRMAGNAPERKPRESPDDIAQSVPIDVTEYQVGSGQWLNESVTEQRIRKVLKNQARLVPTVVKGVNVSVTEDMAGHKGAKGLFTYHSKWMRLHPSIFLASGIKVLKRAHDDKWWVPNRPNTSLHGAVIAHETGHGVATTFGQQRVPQDDRFWLDFVQAFHDAGYTQLPYPQVMDANAPANQRYLNLEISSWVRNHAGIIRSVVSQYGTTNADEMFAELWAEYSTNDVPRGPARIYGDYARLKINGHGGLA